VLLEVVLEEEAEMMVKPQTKASVRIKPNLAMRRKINHPKRK